MSYKVTAEVSGSANDAYETLRAADVECDEERTPELEKQLALGLFGAVEKLAGAGLPIPPTTATVSGKGGDPATIDTRAAKKS